VAISISSTLSFSSSPFLTPGECCCEINIDASFHGTSRTASDEAAKNGRLRSLIGYRSDQKLIVIDNKDEGTTERVTKR
jgi:hypothetical protein